MIYSGIIAGEGGKTLKDAFIAVVSAAGNPIVRIPADENGYWELDTGTDGGLLAGGNTFVFSAPGYTGYGIAASSLSPTFDVSLIKNFSPLPLLLIGGALTLGALSMNKKRKVGKIDNETVKTGLLVAGGVIAFTVVQRVLEGLGIYKSPDEKKLADIAKDPGSFWNPNYWKAVSPGGTSLNESDALAMGWKIYNAMGYSSDDPDTVKGVFRNLRSKAEASYLSWKFVQPDPSGFGKDILEYLKHGKGVFPWNGLPASDIVEITDYINSLPSY